MSRTPPAEIPIDAALVARLVADQFPALADLPIRPLGEGWDNVMFRIGDTLVARLPRRVAAVPLLENERRFLPRLAHYLPIPVPVCVYAGQPGNGYPWPWLITQWFAGDNADRDPPSPSQAPRLAAFLLALHDIDADHAPINHHRGVALTRRTALMHQHWATLAQHGEPLAPSLVALWDEAGALPLLEPPRWLHGDLHYANVLIEGGRFSAIIDWGDICSGDVATDLASFWLLFDDGAARRAAIAAYGADRATIKRAMGWALSWASILRATGLTDNPRHAAAGLAVMRRLLDDVRANDV